MRRLDAILDWCALALVVVIVCVEDATIDPVKRWLRNRRTERASTYHPETARFIRDSDRQETLRWP